MSWISRIFFRKVDREIKRINKRSRIALHAIVYEENLIYRIERILETDKDTAKIKKEVISAKSVKRRFANHINQFIKHSRLIHGVFYPHDKEMKNLIDGLEFGKGMIKGYWNEVFLNLDYDGMKNVIPIYLRLLKRMRRRIKIIKEIESREEDKVEAEKEILAEKAA
ncbi:hypothetical protein KY331_06520 [Candidatus Woesearchaeota archaeon]|nr:hypothetical protein [Candidatus Woesearchaeota archaeon]